jgi:hypothetical protein
LICNAHNSVWYIKKAQSYLQEFIDFSHECIVADLIKISCMVLSQKKLFFYFFFVPVNS